jgi:hypothetical protein
MVSTDEMQFVHQIRLFKRMTYMEDQSQKFKIEDEENGFHLIIPLGLNA